MLLATPLLVLSRPIAVALWAFPRGWRRLLVRFSTTGWIGHFWRYITAPFAAWAIHGVVIWAWHAPILFQAALKDEQVHTVQHLSFFMSALVFWWAIIRGREGARGYGAGVLYLFLTTVHTSLLGALLTFSRQPWYSAYGGSAAAGLSALEISSSRGSSCGFRPARSICSLPSGCSPRGWRRSEKTRAVPQYVTAERIMSLSFRRNIQPKSGRWTQSEKRKALIPGPSPKWRREFRLAPSGRGVRVTAFGG